MMADWDDHAVVAAGGVRPDILAPDAPAEGMPGTIALPPNPLTLLAKSDLARLEAIARLQGVDASALGTAMIEDRLGAFDVGRRPVAGAAWDGIAARARRATQRSPR